MNISYCLITDVKKGVNANKRLSCFVTFDSGKEKYTQEFLYTDAEDVIKFARIWKYLGGNKEEDILGKKIRIVTQNGILKGFGHPEFNVFVPLCEPDFKEVTAQGFKELLNE